MRMLMLFIINYMVRNWQIKTAKFKNYNGMALYPFILLTERSIENNVLINHERIHLRQQLEMGLLLFYIAYLVNYLINRIRYREHYKAYRNIIFEREAFNNETNLEYLNKRPFWSFISYGSGSEF